MSDTPKPLAWIGNSQKELLALHLAQTGGKHDAAKPLSGFGRASILEVVDADHTARVKGDRQ